MALSGQGRFLECLLHDAALKAMGWIIHGHDRAWKNLANVIVPATVTGKTAFPILQYKLICLWPQRRDQYLPINVFVEQKEGFLLTAVYWCDKSRGVMRGLLRACYRVTGFVEDNLRVYFKFSQGSSLSVFHAQGYARCRTVSIFAIRLDKKR